jgi:hypothetical protein
MAAAFFTREDMDTKNNTLLIVTVVVILLFAMYILFMREDLLGLLISLVLIITVGVITIILVE